MSSVLVSHVTTTHDLRLLESLLRFTKKAAWAVINSVWVLMICKVVISFVAAYDTYLTIKYAESLDIYELNPLGRWLMSLDTGPVAQTQQIAAFITAKFIGTLLVLLALQGLTYWRQQVAGVVAIHIAGFQAILCLHLMFGLFSQ